MEIGIDSFAANPLNTDTVISSYHALAELLERMVYADAVGLDTFGIGEHHRKEFRLYRIDYAVLAFSSQHSIIYPAEPEIAQKILRHSDALGGISRVTFQMDNARLSHEQLMRSIEIIGKKVSPTVNH